MKYLTLIRHAKSSRENPRQPDEFRPLDERGRRDAPAMGRYLEATFRFMPDVMVSSPAARTMATARAIAEAIGYSDWQIKQEGRIYEASVAVLEEVVHDQEDEHAHVCLVGHNPGMENFTNWLCGARVVDDVPTCAVIMLEVEVPSWTKVNMGKGKLREYIYPALIGRGGEDP